MQPNFQFEPSEWLRVGLRGGPYELVEMVNLCRRFDGNVLYREGQVMVVEVGGRPEVLDDLLARLPKARVTHLWRSGVAFGPGNAAVHRKTNFCGT